MHIAIAGNIGSGKSTLTQLLAKHYGWEPRYEAVEGNPYLEDYYRDIHRWSFNLEVYFLKERFRDSDSHRRDRPYHHTRPYDLRGRVCVYGQQPRDG